MHPCILWQIANGTALLGEGLGERLMLRCIPNHQLVNISLQ